MSRSVVTWIILLRMRCTVNQLKPTDSIASNNVQDYHPWTPEYRTHMVRFVPASSGTVMVTMTPDTTPSAQLELILDDGKKLRLRVFRLRVFLGVDAGERRRPGVGLSRDDRRRDR